MATRCRQLSLVLIVLLITSACGANRHDPSSRGVSSSGIQGAASLSLRFDRIPQSGDALGSPHAPYTLFEFADLQCPFCARFDRDVLPAVIQRFVRTGRLRIELHPVVLIGPQSEPAALAALAAGLQNRMWQFADLFYRNQQLENSGYVTSAFIARIGFSVPGLQVGALERLGGKRGTLELLKANIGLAHSADVTGTPDFRLGRTGGVLSPFIRGLMPRAEFMRDLEQVVKPSSL